MICRPSFPFSALFHPNPPRPAPSCELVLVGSDKFPDNGPPHMRIGTPCPKRVAYSLSQGDQENDLARDKNNTPLPKSSIRIRKKKSLVARSPMGSWNIILNILR